MLSWFYFEAGKKSTSNQMTHILGNRATGREVDLNRQKIIWRQQINANDGVPGNCQYAQTERTLAIGMSSFKKLMTKMKSDYFSC